MSSRSMVRVASAVFFCACAFSPQGARAEPPESAEAPASTADARPTPPPQADTPKPIAEAPPAGPPKERTAKNAIYAEGLGAGLFYSVNYDRAIGDFAVRVGFEYLSVGVSATNASGTAGASEHATFMAFPITVSYLGVGSLNNMLELGAGATILSLGAGASAFDTDSKSSASGSAVAVLPEVLVGYRYQPADGGFVFRGGLEGLIGGSSIPVLPWPYIALGGAF